MAEIGYFFDAVSYAEADQAYVQQRFRRDGILWEVGSRLALSAPGGMFVRVADGEMMIQGFLYRNTTFKDVAVAANTSGLPRVDRLVLHLDRNGNSASVIMLTGTPSGTPSAPGLTLTTGIWEISLGTVAVANGALAIVIGNITSTILVSPSVQYSQELAAGVVDQVALANSSVGTPQLIVNSVNGTILAAGAVNATNKFAASVVDNAALAANAVTTAKINTGGQITKLQLDYKLATDAFNNGGLSAGTWASPAPNQSFVVDDANSIIEISVRGCAYLSSAGITAATEVSSRINLDINTSFYQLGGSSASATSTDGCNPIGSGSVFLTGLAAGGHNVTVQFQTAVTYTSGVFLRAATQAALEFLHIQVVEHKR